MVEQLFFVSSELLLYEGVVHIALLNSAQNNFYSVYRSCEDNP